MKNLIGAVFLIFILVGCKNNESSQEYDSSANSDTSYSITGESTRVEEKTDTLSYNKEENAASNKIEKESNSTSKSMAGNYIKLGEESDVKCNCYCLDINYSNNSEFCLSKDKMYIEVKFEKNQNGSTNVYYVNPSNKNIEGKDIPWDKFDKNTPIATIENLSANEIKLDWLGFSINGDLAVDYAIYGKKTMEGNYKIK